MLYLSFYIYLFEKQLHLHNKLLRLKILILLFLKYHYYVLLNDKNTLKSLFQGPGVQKTIRSSSHTPEQFNVMPRTIVNNL